MDKRDDKAFLFQTHPNQVRLKNRLDPSYQDCAIRSDISSLSVFGWGADVKIYEKNNNKSYTNNLGTGTYEKPAGCNS